MPGHGLCQPHPPLPAAPHRPLPGAVLPARVREDYRQVVRRVELFCPASPTSSWPGCGPRCCACPTLLDFEGAARLRDSIRAIRDTVERQAAVLSDGRDLDVIGVHGGEGGAALALVFVRQGRIIDGQTFWFAGASVETSEDARG
jgi:excinuclease ABC subunit C